MADLAALRRTDAARLTVGPRGHVVVEQEVLVRLRAERVHQLVHARHRHGDDVHHLGLATLEQAAAVRRREHGDLAAERAQVAGPRPSMRSPRRRCACGPSFLVRLRTASLISRSRPANSPHPRRPARRWPRRRPRRSPRCARPWRLIVTALASSVGDDRARRRRPRPGRSRAAACTAIGDDRAVGGDDRRRRADAAARSTP